MNLIICLFGDTLFLMLLFLIGWSDAYTQKIPNRYVAGLILWWLINELFFMAADPLIVGTLFKTVGIMRAGVILKAEGVLGAGGIHRAGGILNAVGLLRAGGILRILGAAAIAMLVLIVSGLFRFLTKRKGIGSGDIKLLFAITLYIGFEQGLILILVSCIFAVINLLCHAVKGHSTILNSARFFSYFPFGPSIVCAAVLVMMEAQLEKSCI